MNAEQKVSRATDELLRDQRFFGRILCVRPIIPATHVRGEVIDTMATDGAAIYYNPAFVDRLTLGQTKGVLMHEAWHIAAGHHLRRGKRDAYQWNVACDYPTNGIVLANGMHLPAGALVNPDWSMLAAEQVFNILNKPTPPQPPPPPQDGDGEGEGESGEDADSQPDPDKGEPADDAGDGEDDAAAEQGDDDAPANDGSEDEGQDDGDGDGHGADDTEAAAPGNDGSNGNAKPGKLLEPVGENGGALSEAERDEAESNLRTEIIQAAKHAEGCGQIPVGAERIIAEAKQPRDDWRDVLRNFAAAHVTTPVDSTWGRINRRFIGTGTYLPGKRCEDTTDLVLVIDDSASMDDNVIGKAVAELRRIVDDTQPANVWVLLCNTKVHKVDHFPQGEPLEVTGFETGGTRFSPAFAKVAELGITVAGLVYLTDLQCSDFGPAPEYPVLWGAYGNPSRRVPPPFGEVMDLNEH